MSQAAPIALTRPAPLAPAAGRLAQSGTVALLVGVGLLILLH